MTTSTSPRVHYDPYDLDIDDDPYPTWRRLRDEAPLYRNDELDFCALSRWDDVRPALMDWETHRSGRGTVLEVIRAGVEIPPGILLFEDPPIHDAHRALLSRAFTPRRMLDLEPLVRSFCVGALDALVGRDEFDVVGEFGVELPLRTIGFLFGIPEARRRPGEDGPHRQRAGVGPPPGPAGRASWAGAGVTRVVVWSTGGIGSLAVVAVQERPDLELVGVWVHSEEKVGQDAGVLANGVPNGIVATDDVDALLALEPDCVIYGASGSARDAGALPDYERLLAAGVDVVTTTSTTLVNPLAYEPAHRRRLEAAARAGGASIYASGIEPGFLCDHLPLVLSTASRSITKVHCYELALYDDYGVEEIMVSALGFGQPLDFEPWIMLPGAIVGEFQGQVRYIADGLGVEVEEVRETYDRRPTEHPIETAFGTVEPGTCGAIRFQAVGVVHGREAIVIDHVTRLARHVGPDWPIGEADLAYRIVLEGKPGIDCWVTPTLDDPGEAGIPHMRSGAGAMLATAMRVVNAVPYVVDAEPGLLRSLEMPLTLPRHALRGR